MRLILHAGTHKTGTTSIQTALAVSRRWLGTRGVCYPKLDQRGRAHNHFAHRIAMANEADLDGLRTEFRRSINMGQTVLVSAEELSARITGTQYWDGFTDPDFPARKQAYMERLRKVFSDFDEVTVHICFRHAAEYAESLY